MRDRLYETFTEHFEYPELPVPVAARYRGFHRFDLTTCIACDQCAKACPVDCIHPKKDEDGYDGSNQLFIDPQECIDCGACVPVCPVSAIFALDDLPEKWANYAQTNAAHFGR